MASYASPTSRSGRRLGVRSRPRWGFVRDVVRWLLRRRAKIPSQLLSKLAVMDRTPHLARLPAPTTVGSRAGFVHRRRAWLAGSPRARVRARVMRWTSRVRFNWPLATRTLFAYAPSLGRSENFGKQRTPWERNSLLPYLPKKFNQKSKSYIANPLLPDLDTSLNQLRRKNYPSTLRARQAHSRRVPQLSRFRVHSERRGRVLLCRDAFAYCLARTAYCGTSPDTVFTAPATSPNETPAPSLSSGPTSLLVLTNSSTGQKLRAPAHYVCCVTDHPPKRSALACCSRVHPRAYAAQLTTRWLRARWHRELRRSPPRGGPVRIHVRIPCFV